jgi:hypothetical protein
MPAEQADVDAERHNASVSLCKNQWSAFTAQAY